MKYKNILVTQLRFADFTGSEIVTLELIEVLSTLAEKVYVVTTNFSEPVKSEVSRFKNVTVLNYWDSETSRVLGATRIDLAWVHHGLIPMTLLENPSQTKFIFHHMSPFAEYEQPLFPVIENELADKILCNSAETKEAFEKAGVLAKPEKIEVFNNPAPKRFVAKAGVTGRLKKLLVVSNHIPSDLRQALEIIRSEGIEVSVFGVGDEDYRRITPADIHSHDAVVSIGKTVQYAILGNRPVYCYDKFGGPGYLRKSNFDKARDLNFSGRGFSKRDPRTIANEIITGFSGAIDYAKVLHETERQQFTLEDRLERVLDSTKVSKKKHISNETRANYGVLSKLIHVEQPSIKHMRNIEQQSEKSQKLAQDLDRELTLSRIEAHSLRDSNAYRIGRMLTLPVRLGKQAARKLLHPYLTQRIWTRMWETTKHAYGFNDAQKKDITVQLVIRSFYHPTSSTFIRMISPLTSGVLRSRVNIKLVDGDNLDTLSPKGDVIIVQRTSIPGVDDAKRLVKLARSSGQRLFVDSDDAFGELDKKHPQYELQKERVNALDYVMNNADEVWFSTKELSELHKDCESRVIENTIDSRVWRKLNNESITPLASGSLLRMVYMGTATHNQDFAMILPVLRKLYSAHPGSFELTVVGVSSDVPDYSWLKRLSPEGALYPEFAKWFGSLDQFDVGLSPLTYSSFNKSKSDIKCLDYLANGIHPIVSDVEAYQTPDLTPLITRVTNTDEAWFEALEQAILRREDYRRGMRKNVQQGFEYLKGKRSPDIAAAAILEAIERHVGKDVGAKGGQEEDLR